MRLNNRTLPLELEIRKVNLLYQLNVAGIVAITLNTLAYVIITYKYLPSAFLITWFSILNASSMARLVAIYRWKKIKSTLVTHKQVKNWQRLIEFLLLLSGCGWGVIGWLVPHSPLIQQSLTALLIASMTAGALAAHSASRTAMNFVILPAMAPWMLSLFLTGEKEYLIMATLILFYLILMLGMAKSLNASTMLSFNLDIELRVQEAANKAKSIFLANASHEIRTPLSAINGFAENLLRRPLLPASVYEDAQIILKHGKYLAALVDDLLDLSKLETNRLFMQMSPVNIVQEIEDSLSVIKSTLDQKKLAFQLIYETLIPEKVQLDAVRFRQVLINLLTNAVKFTNAGKIILRISWLPKLDHKSILSIVVEDSGLGMSKKTTKNLFQPFVRGETPEIQRVQGSGLGLALSLNLARMMGGELRLLWSKLGAGSAFEFTTEVSCADEIKLVTADKLRRASSEDFTHSNVTHLFGIRILVADDASDLRVLMKRYLGRLGAKVEVCENGAEAVELALNSIFDVILMDIKMPVMDGYTATTLLRNKGYNRAIIALTAQASIEDQQKCIQAGCSGYLSKPVDMDHLAALLAKERKKT